MKQKFINWTMTCCSASQSAKKDYEWIKRKNPGVVLAKDPPIIKLERGKEIHLLRSIRELKMASSCGYQIGYLFLPRWLYSPHIYSCNEHLTFVISI